MGLAASSKVTAEEIEFVCPHCRARNRAAMVLRVDAATHPTLAERLREGSLFDQVCWQCREPTALDHALLYADPERRVAAADLPPNDPFADLLDLSDAALAGCQLRLVHDMNAVRELAQIWHDGWDDATLLLVKHMLAARVQQESGAPPVLCAYGGRVEQAGEPALEYVLFRTEESEPEAITVPLKMVRDVEAAVALRRAEMFPPGQWIEWSGETAQALWEALHSRSAAED